LIAFSDFYCFHYQLHEIEIKHLKNENGLLPNGYRVIVKFHSIDKPYCVLLKVRNSEIIKVNETKENDSIESQEFFKPFIQLHEREVKFYNEIAPWVSLPIPMVYYSQIWDISDGKEGIIVQEDLIREAVKQDVYNGLTIEQVESVLKYLAEFHAAIICNSNIDEILSHFAPLPYRCVNFNEKKLIDDLNKVNINGEELRRFIINESNNISTDRRRKTLKRTVLVHGNLWSANVKFKKSLLGKACTELRGILNWQHCHEGSPLEDVASLIVTSTNSAIRKENLNRFLYLYYEQLRMNLKIQDKKIPYSLNEIHTMYNEEYSSQVYFLLLSHISFIISPIFADKATENQKEILLNRLRDAFEEIRLNYS
uniref:CHK kinase-like domain-containing protein n=1 Tax=Parascaris univalens TaxID=6257 RepID=A0A915BTQ7_PARUN